MLIVEGDNDQQAFELFFEDIFNSREIRVCVMGGDVTSDWNVGLGDIVSTLGDSVKNTLEDYYFTTDDLALIVHIVDTDGAFVPEDAIIEFPNMEGTTYSTTKIMTHSRDDIVDRNARKSKALGKLIQRRTLCNAPYSVYYMSSNLEHVLADRINCKPGDKSDIAGDFADKYADDIRGFIDFICSSDFSVGGSYRESWEYIQQGLHSLERHTNLGICFPEK